MALAVDFTFGQSADCKTITFTETTGDATGGYSDAGNPAYSAVTNTLLEVVLPNSSTVKVHKDYLPTQDVAPNGTKAYLAEDVGYTTNFPNGVWDVTFKVFTIDTPSGGLVQGTEYIVTGTGGQITYDGNIYKENELIVATAVTTYVEDTACSVNVLEAKKNCNFLIYCGVRECLKKLMLQRCGSCDCREDFHRAMNELIIDFNAAQLSFTEKNYKCANDTIKRLEKQCGGICNDCGC